MFCGGEGERREGDGERGGTIFLKRNARKGEAREPGAFHPRPASTIRLREWGRRPVHSAYREEAEVALVDHGERREREGKGGGRKKFEQARSPARTLSRPPHPRKKPPAESQGASTLPHVHARAPTQTPPPLSAPRLGRCGRGVRTPTGGRAWGRRELRHTQAAAPSAGSRQGGRATTTGPGLDAGAPMPAGWTASVTASWAVCGSDRAPSRRAWGSSCFLLARSPGRRGAAAATARLSAVAAPAPRSGGRLRHRTATRR